MRNVLSALVVLLPAAASLTFAVAQAHGGIQPEHGGVVQLVGDASFELVAGVDGVELYVEDDGDEVTSVDMAAKLTIVNAGTTLEMTLMPGAGNKFEAKGGENRTRCRSSGAADAQGQTVEDQCKLHD
jgi:hypothetical protein